MITWLHQNSLRSSQATAKFCAGHGPAWSSNNLERNRSVGLQNHSSLFAFSKAALAVKPSVKLHRLSLMCLSTEMQKLKLTSIAVELRLHMVAANGAHSLRKWNVSKSRDVVRCFKNMHKPTVTVSTDHPVGSNILPGVMLSTSHFPEIAAGNHLGVEAKWPCVGSK